MYNKSKCFHVLAEVNPELFPNAQMTKVYIVYVTCELLYWSVKLLRNHYCQVHTYLTARICETDQLKQVLSRISCTMFWSRKVCFEIAIAAIANWKVKVQKHSYLPKAASAYWNLTSSRDELVGKRLTTTFSIFHNLLIQNIWHLYTF